jgi:integration host factor subunit alpha
MEIEIEDLGSQTLTKSGLGDLLCEQIGLNKREAVEMVDSFFGVISQKLVNGTDVKISDFAAFEVRTKAPRPGRNPRTGEIVIVKARRVVTFRAGPNLKERIRGHEG